MELAKNSDEINPHNSDLANNRIDPDRRIDVQNKSYEMNLPEQKIDIDRRIPANIDTNGKLKELSIIQKYRFARKLDFSIDKISDFTIDDKGTLHFETRNHELEGKTAENGVPYFRKQVEINGVKIEGVFPKFKTEFETNLPEDKLRTPSYQKYCNADLKTAIESDPELKVKFTPDQVKQIENGKTPDGYVWHHNEEPGKMQLVKQEDHEGARHTGGSYLWGSGAGSYDRGLLGVHF